MLIDGDYGIEGTLFIRGHWPMQRVTNNTHLASGNCMKHKLGFCEVHQKPETEIHPNTENHDDITAMYVCISPYIM
jgi:hypothetical protein